MTRLLFHVRDADIPRAREPEDVHVRLYGTRPTIPGTATVGNQLRKAYARLPVGPGELAYDFLTIALAVTAADTFVSRAETYDRWSRSFDLVVPLRQPNVWKRVRGDLEAALRFLSGDVWTLTFAGGGPRPPERENARRRKGGPNLSRCDCACLFSGGLDSAIGAVRLMREGDRPLLVSHAYNKDKGVQDAIATFLPESRPRFSANAYPTWNGADDDSMRTRSFGFLGFGVVAASAISTYRRSRRVTLHVPENGTIAINAPLTPRRIGSSSTRTTHPAFLAAIQRILDRVELPVEILNTYRHSTKGEMLSMIAGDGRLTQMAARTVSCGHWKRHNQQCGRCVPCLIRRAAFHAAGVPDGTPYEYPDLAAVMTSEDHRDDLVSVLAALRRPSLRTESYVLRAGPLPDDDAERQGYVGAFARGMDEIESYLRSLGLA